MEIYLPTKLNPQGWLSDVLLSQLYNDVSSDVDLESTDGEFISPKRIIEIMEENGLTLTTPYEYTQTDFASPWPVVTFTFEK